MVATIRFASTVDTYNGITIVFVVAFWLFCTTARAVDTDMIRASKHQEVLSTGIVMVSASYQVSVVFYAIAITITLVTIYGKSLG